MSTPLVQAQLAKDTPYAWFLFDRAKQNSRYYLPDFKEQTESVEACLDAFVVALQAGKTAETGWIRMIGAVALYWLYWVARSHALRGNAYGVRI